MSTNDNISPMQKMLAETNGDIDLIGERVAAVLEFLTLRAVMDAPFVIYAEDDTAMVLVAANEHAEEITGRLSGMEIKRWEDELDEAEDNVIPFNRDSDPGDEQDEPATESE